MENSQIGLAAQRKDFDVRTFTQIQERKGLDTFRTNARRTVLKGLMTPQMDYLNNLRYSIITKHVEKTHTDGFYHRGVWYTNFSGQAPATSLQKQSIHESLLPEIFDYERLIKDFNADKVSIEQGISLLLREAKAPQDIRDALPEVLLPVMGSPEHLLQRTRPELYTLTSELHKKQFEKVMEKIYFYLATALLR